MNTSCRGRRRRAGVIIVLLVLGIAGAGAFDALGASTAVSTFTKTGIDTTNGSTVTSGGASGNVKAGDGITWVLNYANNTGQAADVHMTDPLTGNQTYVPGSLHVPPGFKGQWSTNGGTSYATTEPATGVNAIGATGSVGANLTSATGADFTAQSLAFNTPGGDGYSVEGLGDNLYTVYHHDADPTEVFCATLANAVCPGWPTYATYVSTTAGEPLGVGPHDYRTSGENGSWIAGGNLYWSVEGLTATAGNYPVGVMCLNLSTELSCGFTKLDTTTLAPSGAAQIATDGIPAADGNYYLFDFSGDMLCFTPTAGGGGPCAGSSPVPVTRGIAQSATGGYFSEPMTDGNYVYFSFLDGSQHTYLDCYDIVTQGVCAAGFPFDDGPTPQASNPDYIAPDLDTSANLVAGCDLYYEVCRAPDGTSVTDPWTPPNIVGFGYPYFANGFGSGAIVGTKFYAAYQDTTYCFDFALWNGKPGTRVPFCPGFAGPANSQNYTTRALANLPGCFADDGNAAQIVVFDGTTGGTCNTADASVSANPQADYCDGATNHVSSWGSVSLNGLTGSEYAAASITLFGANGPVPGYSNLPFTGTSISLAGIPTTGPTSQLRAEVTFTGVKSADIAAVDKANLTITWVGDPLQVCFKTVVGPAKCNVAQAVANDATAVTSGPGGSDAPGGNDAGTATFTEGADTSLCVDLAIAKTATPLADPGGPLTYTLTVTNNGPGPSTGYKVSDPLPAGVTAGATGTPGCSVTAGTVNCTEGALAVGASFTITVAAKAPSPFPSGITNTATVTGNETDPVPGNNTSSATTNPAQPSVTIQKNATVAPAADQNAAQVGDVITYTYTVTNAGNVPLATISVTDPTIGAVTCPPPAAPGLTPGASETCTAVHTYTVTQADVDAGSVNDTATATGTDPGGVGTTSPPSPATVPTVSEIDSVSLQKIADASAGDSTAIFVGETIKYSYVVTNTGNVDLKSVSVNDPTVGAVSCPALPAPGLAPGATSTCTGDKAHTVTQADVDAGQVLDTATATGIDPTNHPTDPSNPAQAQVNGTPNPEVSLQKIGTVTPAADQKALKVGDTIAYTYVVTNTGNVDLGKLSVDDPTIGPVNCPSPTPPGLAPGASETCAAVSTYTVTQADVDAGSVGDTATATGTDPSGKTSPPSNPSTVTIPAVPPMPAVSIKKMGTVTPAADQNAVQAGDTIAYSYVVTNTGNVTLKTVAVDDPSLGAVSCPVPAAPGLAPGASETCAAVATYTVTQADIDAGFVKDTATATGVDTGGVQTPVSDPSTVTIPAVPLVPAVSLQKIGTVTPAADQGSLQVGDLIQYTYKVTNTGNATLRSVAVDDPAVGAVSCPPPAAPGLAPGASITCTGNAPHVVTQADVDAGQVTDTAIATGTDLGGAVSPISSPSTVTLPAVPASPTLSLTKIANASGGDSTPIFLGETIQYSYLVTNTGNVTLGTIAVADSTPPGGVTCPALTPPGLAPGQSVTCTANNLYTVTVADVSAKSKTDTATATGTDTHGNNAPPATSSVSVPSLPSPAVAIDKTAIVTPAADQHALERGDTILYSYVVTNTGNTYLTSVAVTDPTAGGVSCPVPAAPGLAPGQSETCGSESAHVVTQADLDAGAVNDTAYAIGTDPLGDNSPQSNLSSVSVPVVPMPSVTVVKSGKVTPAADQGSLKVGDTIAYSYVVTNTGNVDLVKVAVSDPTIGAVTCPTPAAPGLAPDASETCTSVSRHTVTQADVNAGHVVDTASATGTDTGGLTSPPSGPSTVLLPGEPRVATVSIKKTATVSPASDQGSIKIGDTISYSYVVTNTGDVTLKAVAVTDPSLGAVSCPVPAAPGLEPGASETCTQTEVHTVTQADLDAGLLVDSATATGDSALNTETPVSTPSTAKVPADPSPAVSIVKHASVTPAADQKGARVGDLIAYTYAVTNTGNVDLVKIAVSDPSLGAISCPVPMAPGLAPGASETCTGEIDHRVSAADERHGKVVDTATATGSDSKGATSPPASSTVTTPVLRTASKSNLRRRHKPRLIVRKRADRHRAKPGEPVRYTITVRDPSSVAVHAVKVCDTVPRGLVFVRAFPASVAGPGGRCWHAGTLAPGHTDRFRLVANVAPGHGGAVVNTATASGRGVPPTHASAVVHVVAVPPVACGSSVLAPGHGRGAPVGSVAC